jgi:hypothetical protein
MLAEPPLASMHVLELASGWSFIRETRRSRKKVDKALGWQCRITDLLLDEPLSLLLSANPVDLRRW